MPQKGRSCPPAPEFGPQPAPAPRVRLPGKREREEERVLLALSSTRAPMSARGVFVWTRHFDREMASIYPSVSEPLELSDIQRALNSLSRRGLILIAPTIAPRGGVRMYQSRMTVRVTDPEREAA